MIKGMTFIGTIYVVGRNMRITNNTFLLKKGGKDVKKRYIEKSTTVFL